RNNLGRRVSKQLAGLLFVKFPIQIARNPVNDRPVVGKAEYGGVGDRSVDHPLNTILQLLLFLVCCLGVLFSLIRVYGTWLSLSKDGRTQESGQHEQKGEISKMHFTIS